MIIILGIYIYINTLSLTVQKKVKILIMYVITKSNMRSNMHISHKMNTEKRKYSKY